MLKSFKIFLSNENVKLVLIATIVGGGLKLACKEYIKNNPELFKETNKETKDSPYDSKENKNLAEIRGGELIAFTGMSLTIKKLVIEFVAKNGVTTFVSLALGKILQSKGLVKVLLHNIPETIEHGSVQNLAKKNFIKKKKLKMSSHTYFEVTSNIKNLKKCRICLIAF